MTTSLTKMGTLNDYGFKLGHVYLKVLQGHLRVPWWRTWPSFYSKGLAEIAFLCIVSKAVREGRGARDF